MTKFNGYKTKQDMLYHTNADYRLEKLRKAKEHRLNKEKERLTNEKFLKNEITILKNEINKREDIIKKLRRIVSLQKTLYDK